MTWLIQKYVPLGNDWLTLRKLESRSAALAWLAIGRFPGHRYRIRGFK